MYVIEAYKRALYRIRLISISFLPRIGHEVCDSVYPARFCSWLTVWQNVCCALWRQQLAYMVLRVLNRLMSDYEVTLVNDNSMHLLIALHSDEPLLTALHSVCLPLPASSEISHIQCRQEFYVRFKGPSESTWATFPKILDMC
jgi:hypothetical protein